jgi:hypothetical protein
MATLIEQLKLVQANVLGQPVREVPSADEVLRLLEEGLTDLHLVLDWGEQPQTLVLLRLEGDRVVFHNPLGHASELPVGHGLEDEGPARQVEGSNLESMTCDELRAAFQQRSAVALAPQA